MTESTEKETVYVNKNTESEIAVAEKESVVETVVEKKEEYSAPDIDLSAIVEGAKVRHKKFGEGVINSVDKKLSRVRIRFGTAEKLFVTTAFVNGLIEIID